MTDLLPQNRIEKRACSQNRADYETETKPLVMVVEDHDDSRLMLEFMIESWGYRVIGIADGKEAVNLAELLVPAIILMDTTLPGISGFSAASKIRQSSATSQIPIVFLSGQAESCFRKVAEIAGANDYLVKPLDLLRLESVIKEQITIQNFSSDNNSGGLI